MTFLEGHFVKLQSRIIRKCCLSKVLTQHFTSENPLSVTSLHIIEHLSDFEGIFLLSALCDHFFYHTKESRPQAFAEAVNKVSHLSAKKLHMDYVSQELTNSQLCDVSPLWLLWALMFVWKTFHLSRPCSTILFFNRDSQRQPVSHVDLLPPTVLF